MGDAYRKVVSDQPERLMMQMQMYLAVAAAFLETFCSATHSGAFKVIAA